MNYRSRQMLNAGAGSTTSDPLELVGLTNLTATIVLSVTLATLQGSLTFNGTNDDPEVSLFPTLSAAALITPVPAGVTLVGGVLTFNNPAIGAYEIGLSISALPKWIRNTFIYTSGGGSVGIRTILTGWGPG